MNGGIVKAQARRVSDVKNRNNGTVSEENFAQRWSVEFIEWHRGLPGERIDTQVKMDRNERSKHVQVS